LQRRPRPPAQRPAPAAPHRGGGRPGYSGLWLALALRSTGGRLITHELDPERAREAEENFAKAGVADLVTIVVGDAN
jgi:predicted O-methyltransferase YrrM